MHAYVGSDCSVKGLAGSGFIVGNQLYCRSARNVFVRAGVWFSRSLGAGILVPEAGYFNSRAAAADRLSVSHAEMFGVAQAAGPERQYIARCLVV